MTAASLERLTRGWGVAVAAVGVATSSQAARAADFAAGDTDGRPDPRLVRILGIRQVGQGALVVLRPTRAMASVSLFADASHALSMITLAAYSTRYRRAALFSAGIAFCSAGVGVLAARQR